MFRFPTDRTYFIAEVGPNHDGDLAKALEIVGIVARSGADAVKFQTYSTPANVVAARAPLAEYMKGGGTYRDQHDLLERVRLSFEDFRVLAGECRRAGIAFVSTPFDLPAVDLMVELEVPFIKIPSGEITNAILLRAVAGTGRPIVLSSGMSSLDEVEAALDVIRDEWRRQGIADSDAPDIVLLHCTSAYPAPLDAANLRAMATMAEATGLPVGYSDHTIGWTAPLAATSLGARVIEKHVTPDPGLPGPDHAASLPLAELPGLIEAIRKTETVLGSGDKEPQEVEQNVRHVARRSIAAGREIAPGQVFAESDLVALRPATGISPMEMGRLVGRRAKRAYRPGEIIARDELDD